MNKTLFFFLLLIPSFLLAGFDDLFLPGTLRLDYYHAGNSEKETFYFDRLKTEPYWGGSKTNLVDTFYFGNHFYKVFDAVSDSLIYSRGFSSLFNEWQTTPEAKTVNRSFSESVNCPLPKKDARLVIYSRNKEGEFVEKFEYLFHPDDPFISKELKLSYPSFDSFISGDPDTCVDIVILPEGYTKSEMGEFIGDCRQFADILFQFDPYKKYRDNFNIRGILAPSPEQGSDIPRDSVYRNTLLGTSFYTFDSERYCMTNDFKTVRDLAANAPYDQIYILVNSPKYGGGAIYNYYSVSVNSNLHAAKIFVHEFAHGFAGLGDEYYNAEVAYSDFYSTNVEPWEANLTTLVDFNKKWKNLLAPGTPVPTPTEPQYIGKTGVFEGGGYAAKGVYRPGYDCLMNTFNGNSFCDVCRNTIEKMIKFYTE